jgi:hypothetical protein
VAEDEDTRHRMSATLRKFYDAHGVAPVELVHGSQRGHGLSTASPGQIRWPPSSGQGLEGRSWGGRALSCNGCRWILCRKNTGYHATDPKI